MSKKDFIALADMIRRNRADFSDEAIRDLGAFCASQNHNFKWQRWIGYINGENGANGGAVKKAA